MGEIAYFNNFSNSPFELSGSTFRGKIVRCFDQSRTFKSRNILKMKQPSSSFYLITDVLYALFMCSAVSFRITQSWR